MRSGRGQSVPEAAPPVGSTRRSCGTAGEKSLRIPPLRGPLRVLSPAQEAGDCRPGAPLPHPCVPPSLPINSRDGLECFLSTLGLGLGEGRRPCLPDTYVSWPSRRAQPRRKPSCPLVPKGEGGRGEDAPCQSWSRAFHNPSQPLWGLLWPSHLPGRRLRGLQLLGLSPPNLMRPCGAGSILGSCPASGFRESHQLSLVDKSSRPPTAATTSHCPEPGSHLQLPLSPTVYSVAPPFPALPDPTFCIPRPHA